MRVVDYKKSLEALKGLTEEQVANIVDELVIEDEASGNGARMFNMEYLITKEGMTKGGDEVPTGKLFVPSCSVTDGEDLLFKDGVPAIMVTHYKVKTLTAGKSDDGDDAEMAGQGQHLAPLLPGLDRRARSDGADALVGDVRSQADLG